MLEHRCGTGVQLALHQAIHQMNKRGLGAGLGEPVSRFDAEESAANHDDARAALRSPGNRLDVGHVAKREHAGKIRRR